jgi:hypothetical protein
VSPAFHLHGGRVGRRVTRRGRVTADDGVLVALEVVRDRLAEPGHRQVLAIADGQDGGRHGERRVLLHHRRQRDPHQVARGHPATRERAWVRVERGGDAEVRALARDALRQRDVRRDVTLRGGKRDSDAEVPLRHGESTVDRGWSARCPGRRTRSGRTPRAVAARRPCPTTHWARPAPTSRAHRARRPAPGAGNGQGRALLLWVARGDGAVRAGGRGWAVAPAQRWGGRFGGGGCGWGCCGGRGCFGASGPERGRRGGGGYRCRGGRGEGRGRGEGGGRRGGGGGDSEGGGRHGGSGGHRHDSECGDPAKCHRHDLHRARRAAPPPPGPARG